MSRRILRMQGMRIRRMVATRARMFPFPSDVVGEDITTTTEITVGIAMGGIRDGIAGDIRLRGEVQVWCEWCCSRLLGNRREGVFRGQLLKHAGKAVKANTMADLPPRSRLVPLPAYGLLAPSAENLAIPLACHGLARLRDQRLGRGDERA